MKKFFLGIIFEILDNTIIITVMHTIAIAALLAILFLMADVDISKLTKTFITYKYFKKAYLYIIINGVLIVTLNNLIFRNLFGFITLFITTLVYAAIVKYFTGSVLLFYDIDSITKNDGEGYFYLLFFAGYIDIIYYIGLARLNRLTSAIIYRTTNVN